MDFNCSDEQRQMADSVRRWIEQRYSFSQRRQIIRSDAGISDQAWAELVELGLTALPVPEEQGGLSGSALDMLMVMQELGRGMVVEPYFATMLGAEFLRLAGSQQDLLAQVAAGNARLACALGERQSRHELHHIRLAAARNGENGYALNGAKTVVLHGAQASHLVVSARTYGAAHDTDGISLFVVSAEADGLLRRDYRTIDGMRAADIVFDGVQVGQSALLGAAGRGWPILEAACDYGAAMLCAEALGALDALVQATLDYARSRKQFGVPIAQFQVLQHRMVDMYIHLEQARSLTMLACGRMTEAAVRPRLVSAAKARVGQAIRYIGQQAVQLHGGMGVTDDLPVAHWFKRLTMIELTLGDTDHHLSRFAALPDFGHPA